MNHTETRSGRKEYLAQKRRDAEIPDHEASRRNTGPDAASGRDFGDFPLPFEICVNLRESVA